MYRPAFILALSATLLAFGLVRADDENQKLKQNKNELDQVKKQLSETQRKVDSLQKAESSLLKTISKYSERVNLNRRVAGNLEKQLGQVREELKRNVSFLDSTAAHLDRVRGGFHTVLADYYRRWRSTAGTIMLDLGDAMTEGRLHQYLRSVSNVASREIVQAGDTIRQLAEYVDSLERTGADLTRQRKEKKAKINLDLALKEKEEASLGSVRRQTNLLQDRLVSLSEVARQMEDIIAELERTQAERARAEGPPPRRQGGSFAQLKGALTPPIKGKIVSTFGWKKDKITNLTSFAPGIDIQPARGQTSVRACALGRVAYTGSLRGYDKFVILEHDNGYYSTYAGLSMVRVEMNELIDAGGVVGTCAQGNVHFVLSIGREQLDPVIWLDVDGF
jgi:septal ring factor EnvC (AmiA/AmiB activator)